MIRKKITASMTGSFFLEANRFSASQKFQTFYEMKEVYYPLMFPILCHVNLAHTPYYLRHILSLSAHIWRNLGVEGGSTRSHFAENWLWEKLWTCRKTECGMMLLTVHLGVLRRFFPPGFPTRMLYAFLFCPTRTTCPVFVTSLDFVNLMMYCEECES
jgi:hypothetical protein